MCSVLSYNVAGIGNKVDKAEFFSLVKRYDLFFLFETFVEKKNFYHFESMFSDYKLFWIWAVKENKYKRAKGGSIYGIKLGTPISNLFDFVRKHKYAMVSYKIDADVFNFLPLYVSGSIW